jgi:hypothetical protein
VGLSLWVVVIGFPGVVCVGLSTRAGVLRGASLVSLFGDATQSFVQFSPKSSPIVVYVRFVLLGVWLTVLRMLFKQSFEEGSLSLRRL